MTSATTDLAQLIEPLLNNPDQLWVQKTQMGGTEAYLGSVTLEWLSQRVQFASELPLFQPYRQQQTGNIERVADTVEEILQRPLDWSRQLPLTQYLATHTAHKFPAVLVVLSPAWVDEPEATAWDSNGQAIESAATFQPLDSQGKMGLLDVSASMSIYALDGQHRLMGIQGLMQLLQTGELQPYSKVKKPVGDTITLADMAAVSPLSVTQLQALGTETIGIELIPAVIPGETRQQARQRIRSIFVHVNLMAVKLSKGQLAVLDEDDGFSIITRHVAVTHPLFSEKPGRNPRVNWDSATVAAKSTVLTTLQALKEMSQRYLSDRFPRWIAPKSGLVPLRPADEELQEGIQELRRLWDGLASLPSFQRLEQGVETPTLRRFSFENHGGEGNLLFRPVGQVAIAIALGIVIFRLQFPLIEIIEKLRLFDKAGGFAGMEYPESLWYGVLYDPNKRRIRVAGKDLAAKLIVYLLGGIQEPMDRAQLRQALVNARTFENKAISFDGRFVKPKQIGLPDTL